MFLLLLACATPETETELSQAPVVDPNDQDGDGVLTAMDCDDEDPEVWMDREWGTVLDENLSVICTATCSLAVGEVYLQSPESLEALHCLTSVGGNFEVADLQSGDLHGLEQLVSVGGDFVVEGPNLGTLDGLDALVHLRSIEIKSPELFLAGPFPVLTTVTTVRLDETPKLDDLSGLSEIGYISSLYVTGVSSLAGLEGVQLDAFYGSDLGVTNLRPLNTTRLHTLQIDGAPALEHLEVVPPRQLKVLSLKGTALPDLQDLRYLEAVEQSLTLNDNTRLVDLQGREQLVECGDLELSDNTSLGSLQGLEGLEQVGNLSIYRNDSLADLDAIHGLEQVDELLVVNNPLLSADEVQALIDAIGLENINELTVQGF